MSLVGPPQAVQAAESLLSLFTAIPPEPPLPLSGVDINPSAVPLASAALDASTSHNGNIASNPPDQELCLLRLQLREQQALLEKANLEVSCFKDALKSSLLQNLTCYSCGRASTAPLFVCAKAQIGGMAHHVLCRPCALSGCKCGQEGATAPDPMMILTGSGNTNFFLRWPLPLGPASTRASDLLVAHGELAPSSSSEPARLVRAVDLENWALTHNPTDFPCPYQCFGCPAVGRYTDIQSHARLCCFQPIYCVGGDRMGSFTHEAQVCDQHNGLGRARSDRAK